MGPIIALEVDVSTPCAWGRRGLLSKWLTILMVGWTGKLALLAVLHPS